MRAAALSLSLCLASLLCACGSNASAPERAPMEEELAARVAADLAAYANERQPESLSETDLAAYAREAAAFNQDPDQYRRDAAVKASLAQRAGQTLAKRPGDTVAKRPGDLAGAALPR